MNGTPLTPARHRLRRALGLAAGTALVTSLMVGPGAADPPGDDSTAGTEQGSGSTDQGSTSEAQPRINQAEPATPTAAQTLRWTANNSVTEYASVTTEAVEGPATIVFENSEATGNNSGMQHTLTFDDPGQEYNGDVDLNLTAYPSDDNGGVATAEVVLSPGRYHFICVIPGHGEMQGTLLVTEGDGDDQDTTAPQVEASVDGQTDESGGYIGVASVSLTATDDSSGVEKVEYRLDDGEWQAYTAPVEVTAPGEHTVAYRATDAAGNTSEVGESSFTVVEGTPEDVTAPSVSAMLHGDTNADGAYVGTAEVMVEAADDGSGVDTVEYRLDDGDWQAYTEPVAVDAEGDHVVRYRATDAAGNTSEVGETSFTVVPGAEEDTTPPQVSATLAGTQAADWSYRGAVTLTLEATDEESGMKQTEYRVDDGDWQAYTEPVNVDGTGDHVVRYRATDAAGNTSEVGRVDFSIGEDAAEPACPNPDTSPTVVIGDVGTGVRNRALGDGCRIEDRIRDESRWFDHEEFLDHVRTVTATLAEDGYLGDDERAAVLDAAATAGIGD